MVWPSASDCRIGLSSASVKVQSTAAVLVWSPEFSVTAWVSASRSKGLGRYSYAPTSAARTAVVSVLTVLIAPLVYVQIRTVRHQETLR